jgi:hypothetical protein
MQLRVFDVLTRGQISLMALNHQGSSISDVNQQGVVKVWLEMSLRPSSV